MKKIKPLFKFRWYSLKEGGKSKLKLRFSIASQELNCHLRLPRSEVDVKEKTGQSNIFHG